MAGDAPVTSASRSYRAARIVGLSVLGWIGVSVGLGIGLPRLLDAQVTPGAVAAVVALVLGLCALAACLIRILRGGSGWRRLVVVPWLLVVLVGTYSLSIALAATVVAATASPSDPPTALPGAREVTMTAADGVALAGWYVPGSNGAGVILRHGSGSERSATVDQAAVLARHGYAVLLVDARGHGRSAGRAMDLGWNGDADTAAALGLLAAQPGVDPDRLAVLGLSMGGEEAIGAAAADPRVRAVVAEGVTGRTAADKRWLSEEYGAAGVLQEQVDRLTYGLVGLLAEPRTPITLQEAVERAAPTPMLVIAAGEVPDEQLVGRRLAAAAPGSVTLWVVPGAGHTGGLDAEPLLWEQQVVGFLDAALPGSDR
jgi:pimeloyl-ACP methyl ester carboxylesterase